MIRRIGGVVRIVLPLTIIGFLVWFNWSDVAALWRKSLDYGMLSAALALVLASLCLTIIRWFLLVRALDIDFGPGDAFRLGFLAYLFNFVSPSSVGGDLFKAFFIARDHPGRRVDAVATVLIDRVVGLFGLLLVASVAIVTVETRTLRSDVAYFREAILVLTVAATIALPTVLLLGMEGHRRARWIAAIPIVGGTLADMSRVVRRYAGNPWTLAAALAVSISAQCLLCLAFYFTARAIFDFESIPTVAEHFFIAPLSQLAGAVPLPGGLGATEMALAILYDSATMGSGTQGQGVAVGIALRVMEIAIAVIGAVYYLASRRQVADVIQAASAQAEESAG